MTIKKDLVFSTQIEFIEASPVQDNPMISEVKIRIARPGQGNQFYFEKEVLEQAARKSLGLTPIVAYYNHYKEDFGEHGQQAVYDKFGELITIGDTKAVGIIPENPTIFWDEEDFLVTHGYLWTTMYKEVVQALEGRPQSMELSEEHTIMQPLGDGRIEILDTYFKALCILGSDVRPAFTGAEISSPLKFQLDEKVAEDLDKGVNDFMTQLKFALNDAEKADLIVDTDGEERDIKNRKKVSTAIDTLDDVAEESENPENISKIDDAITVLVDAETEMKREADVIPATEKAQEALQGSHDSKEGIVSVEELSYSSKKKNSLLQPEEGKEEDEELAEKKKKEEEVVVEEEVKQEQPEQLQEAQAEETTEAEDVATPSGDTEGPGEVTDGPTEPVESAEEPVENTGVEEETQGVEEGGEFVQGGSQEETSDEIGTQRQTAASKRTRALLSELGDAEILEALTDRIQETEEIKTRLTEILQASIGNEAPGAEVPLEKGEVELQDLGADTAEDTSVVAQEEEVGENGTEEVTEDSTPIGEQEETVEVEETETEKEVVTPAEEEAPAEAEEEEEVLVEEEDDEDKKKKRPNFSADEELNFADILKENTRLKKENQVLLQFKLDTEKVAKEAILENFEISNKAKEDIRLNFSKLSIDEVEEKAIIAEYKETKLATGQKTSEEKITFSSVEEEVHFIDKQESDFDVLRKFLNKE